MFYTPKIKLFAEGSPFTIKIDSLEDKSEVTDDSSDANKSNDASKELPNDDSLALVKTLPSVVDSTSKFAFGASTQSSISTELFNLTDDCDMLVGKEIKLYGKNKS